MMPARAVDRKRVRAGGAVSYSAMSAQVAIIKFDSKQIYTSTTPHEPRRLCPLSNTTDMHQRRGM
jgi:hypothetical protein